MKEEKTPDREDQNSFEMPNEGEQAGIVPAGDLQETDNRKEYSSEESGSGSKVVNRSKGRISPRKLMLFCVVAVLILSFGIVLIGEIAVRCASPQPLSGSWRIASDDGLFVHAKNIRRRHQFEDRVAYYRINSLGHRDHGAREAQARILVLGDSFSFGWLLSDDDHYVSLLQDRIDAEFGAGKVALLNAAHGGWGTSDYVRYYEDHGTDLNVDAAIAFLNFDDIGRSLRNGQYHLEEGTGELVPLSKVHKQSRLKKLMNSIPGYNWLLEHSHLVQLARKTALSKSKPAAAATTSSDPAALPRFNEAISLKLAKALFLRMTSIARGRKQTLMVLTTGFFFKIAEPTDPTGVFHREAQSVFRDLMIPYADITAKLSSKIQTESLGLSIPGDGHPNEAGAKLIAELNWPHVEGLVRQILVNKFPAE